MGIRQAHPVFELLLDVIELDTEVVTDTEKNIVLLVEAKNMRVFSSLPAFAASKCTCPC